MIKPLGISFLGAGNHGRHHMGEFARLLGTRLVSVYDPLPDSIASACRDFPPLQAAGCLAEVLNNPEVDAVVIATPAETHLELILAALGAKKHVLLEKPVAHTPEAAHAIWEAAKASPDCVVLVGHCERFNPSYRDVSKAVRDGHVGTPRFISASRISPLRLNDPAWKLGVLDTAVHDIDIMLWLMNDLPVAVAAQGTTATPQLTIADNVAYQIRFANGGLAQGHISWIPFSDYYPMNGNAHPRLFLVGTEGSISLDLWTRPVAVQSHKTNNYFWPDSVLTGYADYFTEVTAQDYAFVCAIRERDTRTIGGGATPEAAYNALRVAGAAHESLQNNGGFVTLSGTF